MKSLLLSVAFRFVILMLINFNAFAAEDAPLSYEDQDIRLRFVQFTPQQIGAFYEGREFSKAAVEKLVKSCYVTVILKNKTSDILWLDLDQWEFSLNGKKFNRHTRAYWEKQWDDIKLKKAHRSTFNWTLMPAVRNLYPQEGVGGRIPIPMQSASFSLTLNFPTGKNKQGKMKTVKIEKLTCIQNDSK